MKRNIGRRRVRKRRRPGEISKMKFAAVIAIMVSAVLLGYLTARFVIGPLLGYNADESPIKITGQQENNDDKDKKENKLEKGYALQFGVFSTKEAADKLAGTLSEKGIETEVIEADNLFKVISPVIKTKEEAVTQLNNAKDKNVKDVFIASF